MALFNSHPGSWSVFGQKLPDFGITELFTNNRTSQGGSNLFNPQSRAQSTGSVLGTQTYGPNMSYANQSQAGFNPQPTNTGLAPSGGGAPQQNFSVPQAPQTPSGPSIPNYEDQVRGQINSGYDQYFGQLDQIFNTLPTQAEGQNQQVQNVYNQNLNSANSQLDQSKADLGRTRQKTETNQAKSLNDLAESMRNNFLTGQNMLGARGAGDSSAVNQYSFALTKLGNKQRGDVTAQTAQIMADIDNNEFKLKNMYDTEIKNLALERDTQLQSISQWLAEQQNNIRQARASGQLNRSQDLQALSQNLLNQALSQAQQIQTAYLNRQGMLEQWATNKSNSIGELRNNLAAVGNTQYSLPAFQPINGTPSAPATPGTPNLFGMGNTSESERRKSLFGI